MKYFHILYKLLCLSCVTIIFLIIGTVTLGIGMVDIQKGCNSNNCDGGIIIYCENTTICENLIEPCQINQRILIKGNICETNISYYFDLYNKGKMEIMYGIIFMILSGLGMCIVWCTIKRKKYISDIDNDISRSSDHVHMVQHTNSEIELSRLNSSPES